MTLPSPCTHTKISTMNQKLPRPTRRSIGFGSDGRPESPLARPSSPHGSGDHGTSGNHARASHVDLNSRSHHVHALQTSPGRQSPKPTRKVSASSQLNKTYPFNRFSDVEYSSGESDSRSGYESYDGAMHNLSRERSPQYYPGHDNDYSSGGNHSPVGEYRNDTYPYGGNQAMSGYAYDRQDVYQWNSTPVNQSGSPSSHHTRAYAYVDDVDDVRAAATDKEAKKMQQLQAYVAWVNSQLKKRQGCRIIEDLRRDMQDGVPLVHLVEIVSGETLARVDYSPQTTTAMRDNVERVLQFMTSKRIRMHHTSAKDIVDGNLKAIMRLILALAAHYKPSSVKQTPQPATTSTPTGRKAQRQASFVAMAANAAAAIHDVRKEAAGAGSSLRRYREQRGISLHSQNATSPVAKDPIQQRLRGSSSSDGERPNSRASPLPPMVAPSPSPAASRSPTPSSMTRSSDRSIIDSPRLHVSGITHLDSDQGSPEEGRSRSSSRRSSIAWSEALLEEHIEMTGDIENTKKLLNQLQELLLSGRLQDDDGSSEAEEDQMMFEGSNAREQLVVLQARLNQSQEECSQLKGQLSKTKQECRNLQGTKAGLQSRLTEQDNALLQMKAEILRVGFTQQNQDAEKSDLKRRLEEKERMTSDLTRQMHQKSDLLKQQQEQIENLTQQLQEINSFKTELQNQLENKTNSGDYGLETQLQELTQRLDNVNMAEANLAAHITSQDTQLTKLEDRMHSTVLPFKEGSEELQTMRSALRSLRSNMSSHDPNHHSLDSLEQGICTLMDHVSMSQQRGIYKDSDTSSTESLSKRHSNSSNSQELNHRSSHQQSNYGKSRSSSISSTSSTSSACTKVLYFTERTVTPFMNSIPKRLGEVTLCDFKQIFDREGNYRYHFKALDPEFGTIKEEVVDDDAILPGWEGKIVGWVEQDNG